MVTRGRLMARASRNYRRNRFSLCHSRNSRRGWLAAPIGPEGQRLSVIGVILATVLPLFLQPRADFELELPVDGHIAQIEQGVQVGPSTGCRSRRDEGPFPKWLDVRRLKHRQPSLAGDRASSLVCIRHKDTERALAQAAIGETWRHLRYIGGANRTEPRRAPEPPDKPEESIQC